MDFNWRDGKISREILKAIPKEELVSGDEPEIDMTKTHWTQTPEGKLRIQAAMKLAWKKRREEGRTSRLKKHWTQTPKGRKHMAALARLKTREAKQRGNHIEHLKRIDKRYAPSRNGFEGGVSVTIEGPDAGKAVAELISNIEYDRLNVRVQIERK